MTLVNSERLTPCRHSSIRSQTHLVTICLHVDTVRCVQSDELVLAVRTAAAPANARCIYIRIGGVQKVVLEYLANLTPLILDGIAHVDGVLLAVVRV